MLKDYKGVPCVTILKINAGVAEHCNIADAMQMQCRCNVDAIAGHRLAIITCQLRMRVDYSIMSDPFYNSYFNELF